MSGLCKKINIYLRIFGGVLALMFVVCCSCWLCFAMQKNENLLAEEGEPSGFWLDDGNYEALNIQEGQTEAEITSAEQFAWVCKQINEGANAEIFDNITFFVTQDLDFSAHYWVPLGYVAGSANNLTRAKFEAKPKNNQKTVTLSGVKINNSITGFVNNWGQISSFGFLGVVGNCLSASQGGVSGFVLRDVSVKIDISKVEAATVNIGALVGNYESPVDNIESAGAIKNCCVSGSVEVFQSGSTEAKTVNIGGVVGRIGANNMDTGTEIVYTGVGVSAQTNKISISVQGAEDWTCNVGGIIGENSGSTNGANSLGVVGVENIINITANIGNVGGIVGSNTASGTIKNINFGIETASVELESENSCIKVPDYTSDLVVLNGICAGGIVGNNKGEVSKCTNYAAINTYLGVLGGIAGNNSGVIAYCENVGAVGMGGAEVPDAALQDEHNLKDGLSFGGIAAKNYGTISECKNSGTIDAGAQINYLGGVLGGIVGFNYANSTITNCVNYATIAKNMCAAYAGGIAGSNAGKITSDTSKDSLSKFTVNFGPVYANSFAGGIAGGWNVVINNSITQPEIIIENCYNTGAIDGKIKGTSTCLGGILGTARNCLSSSQILNCFNMGEIGSAGTECAGFVGGIVGETRAQFSIKNCANYADLAAVGVLGGLIGVVESSAPTIDFAISTGALLPLKTTNTIIGGLIGHVKSESAIDLSTSIFDFGVAGYGLPTDLTNYKKNKLYQVNSVGKGGSQASFSMKNSPITYFLAKPGVDTLVGREYYSYNFASNESWLFKNSTGNVYYYPIPQVFANIFTTDTKNVGENSLTRSYPCQQLSKVTVVNQLPISWNNEDDCEQINEYFINIYEGIIPDVARDEILAGAGQYIITGQAIAEPTASQQALYLNDFDNATDFNSAVNDLGWSGKFDVHEGYSFEYRKNSSNGDTYEFGVSVEDAEVVICIIWTPRKFEVFLYEYNDELNTYIEMQESKETPRTITYSLKAGSTQTIDLVSRNGKDCWGWRLDDTLKSSDFSDEETWIEAWAAEATTQFDSNVFYNEGLKLYCMFTTKKITLRLYSGEVQGVTAYFDGNITQKVIKVKFGVSTNLDIPTLNLNNYTFQGYYDMAGNRLTDAAAAYVHTSSVEEVELIAHWTYIIKTVKYVTKYNDVEIELKEFEVTYGEKLSWNQQMNEQNLLSWGIDYSKIDSTLDSDGYCFAGVYVDPDCLQEFDFNTNILEDTIVYVDWAAVKFKLTLSANIGYDPENKLRDGGWGNGSKVITLQVPYHEKLTTYLENWKANNVEDSALSVVGFEPVVWGQGYLWALEPVEMGRDYSSDVLLSSNEESNFMPANNNLTLYIIWERQSYDLVFSANGGYFQEGTSSIGPTTVTQSVAYEARIKDIIRNTSEALINATKKDDYTKWIFKYWSLSPDGDEITESAIMPAEKCTIYAVYGEQRTVKFYVIGAYPENCLGEVALPDGGSLNTIANDEMAEIIKKMENILRDDNGQSAFEFYCWVEMTWDEAYNITEAATAFDFDTIITDNVNLLAKLKPNENYIPPNKDTTNYIIIAGIVLVASLILLFIVLVLRPGRANLTTEKKAKNKEIQEQLDEIKELERRRKNMENPYD